MKKYKNNLKIWLFALSIAMPFAVCGQVNFMSIFGSANCTNNSKMICTTPPSSSSLSGINDLHDIYIGFLGYYPDYFKNSCYDKNGNLLFSVNADGIYDNTGTMQYDTG